MALSWPAWAAGAASSWLSIGSGIVVSQIAQVAPAPAPTTGGGGPSLLEGAGIASIIVGVITAIGTQFKPVIEGFFADRRHKREMEALDMANDLAHSNERQRILEDKFRAMVALELHREEELAHYRALVDNNQTMIATLKEQIEIMRKHWNDQKIPELPVEPVLVPVPPLPEPIPQAVDVFPAVEAEGQD